MGMRGSRSAESVCAPRPVQEVFLTSEYICIVMEYATGGSLFHYVQKQGKLKVRIHLLAPREANAGRPRGRNARNAGRPRGRNRGRQLTLSHATRETYAGGPGARLIVLVACLSLRHDGCGCLLLWHDVCRSLLQDGSSSSSSSGRITAIKRVRGTGEA